MKKNFLAMLLAVVMAVGLLPAAAFAADETSGACGDNLNWALVDGVLTIDGTGPMYSYGDFETPWCDHISEIYAIVIGEGVTGICNSAFDNCYHVTEVTVPASLTSIGKSAFGFCFALTGINVASGNPAYVSVDGILFSADMTALHTYPAGKGDTSYTIPDSVTTIVHSAFTACMNLTSVTIPDGVTAIDDWTFNSCMGLTGVTIPDSVTSIGESAFSFCGSLTNVYYGGTAEQWNEISIGDDNDPLNSAEIHYGSPGPETELPKFNDVPGGIWYEQTVQAAVARGLIEGVGGGNFDPDGVLTRGSALVILGRLEDPDIRKGSNPWYQKAVDWAKAKGISDGTNPGDDISREQLAVMLWRYEGKPGADVSVLGKYSDSSSVSSWAAQAMAWAVENKIVTGSGGRLNPQDTADRAQAVTMVMRYCDKFDK